MLGYLLCKLINVLSLDLSTNYTDGPNSQTVPAYAVYIYIMIFLFFCRGTCLKLNCMFPPNQQLVSREIMIDADMPPALHAKFVL